MWIIKHYIEEETKRRLLNEWTAPSLEEAEKFIHTRCVNSRLEQDPTNGLSLINDSYVNKDGYYYACKYIWHVMEIKNIYEIN